MKKYIYLLFTLLLIAACSPADNGTSKEADEHPTSDENPIEKQEPEITLDKSAALEVMNNYKNTFLEIAETSSQDGQVADYQSKQELIDYFSSKVMSDDLATWYAETYFREENGELFIQAMDAPTWLQEDQPFELEKVNDQEYRVIQERNNALLGHVNMIYILAFQGNTWVVKEIQQETMNQNEASSGDEPNVTKKEAVVKVRQSLRISDDAETKVEFDHMNDEGNYVIHVYDLVDHEGGKHTATRGWYIVDKEEGTIENML